MSTTYQAKLQDPRWQRKRLEVFERDGWACRKCGATAQTLHVHHDTYIGGNPWDTPSEKLRTLCCDCHKSEHHRPAPPKPKIDADLRILGKAIILGIEGESLIDEFIYNFDAEVLDLAGWDEFKLLLEDSEADVSSAWHCRSPDYDVRDIRRALFRLSLRHAEWRRSVLCKEAEKATDREKLIACAKTASRILHEIRILKEALKVGVEK